MHARLISDSKQDVSVSVHGCLTLCVSPGNMSRVQDQPGSAGTESSDPLQEPAAVVSGRQDRLHKSICMYHINKYEGIGSPHE